MGAIPSLIKQPMFLDNGPLWIKEDKHPTINSTHIKSLRYSYIKIGKTFGFETTRYLTVH